MARLYLAIDCSQYGKRSNHPLRKPLEAPSRPTGEASGRRFGALAEQQAPPRLVGIAYV
jgi:hypothetical protein